MSGLLSRTNVLPVGSEVALNKALSVEHSGMNFPEPDYFWLYDGAPARGRIREFPRGTRCTVIEHLFTTGYLVRFPAKLLHRTGKRITEARVRADYVDPLPPLVLLAESGS